MAAAPDRLGGWRPVAKVAKKAREALEMPLVHVDAAVGRGQERQRRVVGNRGTAFADDESHGC